MIDKGIFDKWFIWNSSNCECECDKSCGIGEYLHHKNCKCRKQLVDKLVEECTENLKEVKSAKITSAEYENVCKSSCTIYVVLFPIMFTTNIGIDTYFVYYKYINPSKKVVDNKHWFINHIKWLQMLKA